MNHLDYMILLNSPLFSGFGQDDLVEMLACLSAKETSFQKDQYIYTEDSICTQIGIVISGGVMVIKEDYWGNRDIIAKLGPGDMFGESFACSGIKQMPVKVMTTHNTRVIFIDYERISTSCSNACDFHSVLIKNMIKILAYKNLFLNQKIEHINKRSTREKLLSYLSSQSKIQNSNTFSIPFNRQELADYLSVDRSAMSSELGKLRDEGVLEFHKSSFKLL